MDQLQARGVFAALWRRHDDTSYDWRSVLLRAVGGVQALRHDVVGVLEAMEAESARLEAAQGGTAAGWLTPTAIVWGETPQLADARRDELVKLLRGLGFACIDEGLGAERARVTAPCPAMCGPTRAQGESTADDPGGAGRPGRALQPVAGGGLEPPLALSAPGAAPGAAGGPRGRALPPGSGHRRRRRGPGHRPAAPRPAYIAKSTLLAFLGHQFLARVPGGRVVWLDVDADLSTSVVATLAAGGVHLAMGGAGDGHPDTGMALQPLAEVDSPAGFAWAPAPIRLPLSERPCPIGIAAIFLACRPHA